MNITNLEMTQASMEIFAGFVCLLVGLIIIMNRHRKKSIIILKWLFFITAGIFLSESAAYIFRGNTDTFSITMNQASNFSVFTLNIVLANMVMRYIYSVLNEKGIKTNGIYQKTADISVVAVLAILILNIPLHCMYYFDKSNYYHRNFMWYVYTAISLICILSGCFMCIRYRKNISRVTLLSLLSYNIFPVAAILIQSYLYGYSIVNISLAVSLILVLIAYVYDWGKSDAINTDETEKRDRTTQTILMFVMMGTLMSVSIISCLFSLKKMSEKSSSNNSQVIAHMISSKIETQLIKSLNVSETISQDYSIIQCLKMDDASEAEEKLSVYLESIRKGFGYHMVYAVSDITKACYTCSGISNYIDPENLESDKWYTNHINSGKRSNLEVDTDAANHWELSLFVNTDVRDENGEFIGVCGIGVTIEELTDIIKEIEHEYNVNIELTDSSGLIQLSTDAGKTEKEYTDTAHFSDAENTDFFFSKYDDHYVHIKYMTNLGWYLVIDDYNLSEMNYLAVAVPSIVIFMVGLLVLGFSFSIIIIREQKTISALNERKKASLTDSLTGLLNRRAYQEECQLINESGDLSDTVAAVFDVNGLKTVNDTLGHTAGDELITGAAGCLLMSFADYGKIFRIGGDEFAAILHCTEKQAEEAMETFGHMTESWKGKLVKELYVSKGFSVCSSDSNMNFDEHMKAADRKMYADKNDFYIRTGRDRRKR